MENDRSIRRLTALERSASTARVLNLLAVHRGFEKNGEAPVTPLFRNRLLDRSIILKHRLRPAEYVHFSTPRPTATKLLIPIDGADLRVGARTVLIGQKDFDQVVSMVFGEDLKPGSADRQVLELLDGLPSLDPFLLREHLKAHGIEPDQGYFGISAADVQRMFDFVRDEIIALVELSSSENHVAHANASRLVEKLLSNTPDSGFEPLKTTLKLSDKEYSDGVFSWRGFLYYKWVLSDLSKAVSQVMVEIAQIQGRGPKDIEAAAYIPEAKRRLQATMRRTWANVQAMLDVYNRAYASLTLQGQPVAFREFLLSAPGMFADLGEQLGAIQHVVSFWRYRFPYGKPRIASPDELMDLFLDFEDSMAFSQEETKMAWAG
ncbi:hypothetical protein PMI01_02876 [Caulobacter sp. AP07]|uniref:hypothetical protein n=1 Tax=Caulobacter sp. AP07 TaxID=1144304 RepID=UPI000271D9FE|nr:hypothetical protein [Caulobacter sp. AP07]EJL31212.1 hypothetical protein PMI01_02876 [Caulobacter sp. AP07]